MPQFFIPIPELQDGARWGAVPTDPGGVHLACEVNGRPSIRRSRGVDDAACVVRTEAQDGSDDLWLLIAHHADVRINDQPVIAGIAVLDDRDEVHLPDAPPIYFSTEEIAQASVYSGPADAHCPRCRRKFDTDDAAVRCPQCRTWYHHAAEAKESCWACKTACQICTRSTDLDAGLTWVPDDA